MMTGTMWDLPICALHKCVDLRPTGGWVGPIIRFFKRKNRGRREPCRGEVVRHEGYQGVCLGAETKVSDILFFKFKKELGRRYGVCMQTPSSASVFPEPETSVARALGRGF